jgi:hypothetical protein
MTPFVCAFVPAYRAGPFLNSDCSYSSSTTVHAMTPAKNAKMSASQVTPACAIAIAVMALKAAMTARALIAMPLRLQERSSVD